MKIFFSFFAISLLLLGTMGCHKTEDICNGEDYLPDLTLLSATATTNDTTGYFKFEYNIINSTAGIDICKLNVQTADKNHFNVKIFYSESADLSDSILMDEMSYEIDELAHGQKAKVVEMLSFSLDGYYVFYTYCDYHNEVQERSEENNMNGSPFERSSNQGANPLIMHVNTDGNGAVSDENCKRVFVERISTKIEYD